MTVHPNTFSANKVLLPDVQTDGFFVDQSEFIVRGVTFVAKVDGKSNILQVEEMLKLDSFIV